MTELILASASPRRRELLARAGVPFAVVAADVDEDVLPGERPLTYGARVARAKAQAVAALHPDALVLAADTVVTLDGAVHGKAATPAEARAMLDTLAGRTHLVATAVCLWRRVDFVVTTEVDMRRPSAAELDAYVRSEEWRGKAGAYAIQGIGAALVRGIRGSYTNVVGLPLCEVLEALAAAGVPSALERGSPA
jgi:septum formation protein